MCGIIGYTGSEDVKEILLDALELLEYRGYDSAGIALSDRAGVRMFKCAGRVSDLRNVCRRETSGTETVPGEPARSDGSAERRV